MASNPPFELEDQTDEGFFDNLVNDDDGDGGGEVVVSGGGLKSLGSTKTHCVSDGYESDEAKALANLIISEGGNVDDNACATRAIGGDSNVGEVQDALNCDKSSEEKVIANLSTIEGVNVDVASEVTPIIGSVNNVGEQRVGQRNNRLEMGRQAIIFHLGFHFLLTMIMSPRMGF